ncbi:MAG: sulfotransferase, partial [Phycisphaerales bacterium]|nr:sulfotransferase [Phycisphaerales bacterium]
PAIKELHYFSQLHAVDNIKFGPVHRKQQAKEALDHNRRRSGLLTNAIRAITNYTTQLPIPEDPTNTRATSQQPPTPPTHSPRAFGPDHRKLQINECLNYFNQLTNKIPAVQRARKLAELDHIDQEEISDDWYRGIFSFAEKNYVRGEICPCYMPLPAEGINHILRINPNIKIIIIVRDPVDRIWSHLRMYINYSNNDLDLNRIYNDEFNLIPFLHYTDYEFAISRWEAMCGKESVKVVLYDDIALQPQASLNEILQFIDVKPPKRYIDLSDRVFIGEPRNFPVRLRDMLYKQLESQYDYLRPRFPEAVERWERTHEEAISGYTHLEPHAIG